MSVEPINPEDINVFWDEYESDGIGGALAFLIKRHGNIKALEGEVPYLVTSAKERGVDLIKFIKELDEYMSEEVEDDTDGTDNDGGELCDISDSEAVVDLDESESSPSQDDDRGPDSPSDD